MPPRASVSGGEIADVDVTVGTAAHAPTERVAWSSLEGTSVMPGPRVLSVVVSPPASAVEVPVCAGRTRILLDGSPVPSPAGPVVVDLPGDGRAHRVAIELDVGSYEHRVACGAPVRAGSRTTTTDGLVPLDFPSPHSRAGGGHAVVYVPPGHDPRTRGALLVGLHPWNGTPWTYAAYNTLLAAARANDVVLLFPSGLGNSLYTAAAEDEALCAIEAVSHVVAFDTDRVTLWGASMGGAGATTVGFHHPDLFAAIVSLFGDSRYDLSTYVRGILQDRAGAHAVNALDIVDNARNVPVWLIHGEDDHVSPLAQSAVLERALRAKGFAVTFDRVPGAGHEGRVVSAFAPRIVELAARSRRTVAPARVSYWSVRGADVEAYGVRFTRQRAEGDAFFDVGRTADGGLHLFAARNVDSLTLPRGAFGFAPTQTPTAIVDDADAGRTSVTWDPLP